MGWINIKIWIFAPLNRTALFHACLRLKLKALRCNLLQESNNICKVSLLCVTFGESWDERWRELRKVSLKGGKKLRSSSTDQFHKQILLPAKQNPCWCYLRHNVPKQVQTYIFQHNLSNPNPNAMIVIYWSATVSLDLPLPYKVNLERETNRRRLWYSSSAA